MSQPTNFGVPLVADAPISPEAYAIRDDDSLDALLSSNSGTTRPTYAVAGTIWRDSDNGMLYQFDGATDVPVSIEYVKTLTALGDVAATLSGAEMVGGIFTITPTAARVLTTDTALLILAALPAHIDGTSFKFTVVNLAAFDVSIAAGTDVTLLGDVILNNESATFMVYRTSATEVTLLRM